ncbi:hypothetical protein D6D12_06938 [Aureobasidium pullulans]|uniref:IBR domain-containing protein n=1 Tax=Aureobasidium pullulans TaxID=5580 RepID=A0AB74JMU7_AURPU|nr:hypothetical protein D6D12_06938 [Aureobasidium pullulans]
MAWHITNFVKGCALCGLIKRFAVFCATTRGTDFLLAEFRNSVIMEEVLVTLRLDKSSFGHYDFSYLRIDFSTELNVGYAFVNFTHPEHITNFVNAKVGKLWSLSGSTKRCEASYATIQGIDCRLAKRHTTADFGTLRHDSVVRTVRLLLSQRQTTVNLCTPRRHSRVQPICCTSSSLLRVATSSGTTMIGWRSGACLLTATLCRPKLWYHHESDDLPDTSTVGTEAPCPVCADVRRTAFRARNSMSYATDFVWDSLLPSAPVNCAQGRKRSRDNATTIGLFPSRHGKGPYGPGSHYREGTHHQPFGGGSQRLGRRVSTRSSAKFASSVARLYDGFESQDFTWRKSPPGCHRQQYHPGRGGGGYYQQRRILGPYDNDDGNPPPTVRWWFPAIEEVRQHEEQRLVCLERRQVSYRGNGQYQQFGRARHQKCAVLLGYEEVKNMTNAENFTKYDEAAFRAAVSADPEFRYCMSTTCKSGQGHPAGIDEPTFCCRECGHNDCVSCEANWHEGLTCAQYQHSLQRAQEEVQCQQEVARSSTFVGSKLKTSQGTSSLCRALLGQHDRGTSFAIEEERQRESSGGIASPGNDTSTGFFPLSPSSNINQFTSFGGFGGGGTVTQINNGHFPAENYTTAGMDMSV